MDTVPQTKTENGLSNLAKRVLIGATAGPFIFFAIIFSERLFLLLLLALLLFSLKEVFQLIEATGEKSFKFLGGFLGLSVFALAAFSKEEYLTQMIFLGILIFGGNLIFQRNGAGVMGIALSFFWSVYISFGLAGMIFIYRYHWIDPQENGFNYAGGKAASLILLLNWTLDTAAYFIGKRFGRRPFFQWISPKKTVEGAVGGLLCTILMAAAAHFIYVSFIPLTQLLAIGIIVGIGGQIGDLVESSFKRRAALKDSSTIIPGHGGVLDRFDSLYFSAAMVFLYCQIVEMINR